MRKSRASSILKDMKILIVEDEETLRSVLQEKLTRSKYDVFVAKDGVEGFTMAKSKKPDLILLDLVMPKRDGFEVLTMLKDEDDLKNIPVIILSNLEEDENLKKALKLGADDYFVKSEHPISEVVEKVKAHLMERSR